ncbi:hypothetical protein VNO77_19611 [Canavalia gladiata]|uniref:Uncharacterized protein n=1 Tax=Canavalia gladiata TaxID=3824 RepID=A0AAN9QLL0_CANGL
MFLVSPLWKKERSPLLQESTLSKTRDGGRSDDKYMLQAWVRPCKYLRPEFLLYMEGVMLPLPYFAVIITSVNPNDDMEDSDDEVMKRHKGVDMATEGIADPFANFVWESTIVEIYAINAVTQRMLVLS